MKLQYFNHGCQKKWTSVLLLINVEIIWNCTCEALFLSIKLAKLYFSLLNYVHSNFPNILEPENVLWIVKISTFQNNLINFQEKQLCTISMFCWSKPQRLLYCWWTPKYSISVCVTSLLLIFMFIVTQATTTEQGSPEQCISFLNYTALS